MCLDLKLRLPGLVRILAIPLAEAECSMLPCHVTFPAYNTPQQFRMYSEYFNQNITMEKSADFSI